MVMSARSASTQQTASPTLRGNMQMNKIHTIKQLETRIHALSNLIHTEIAKAECTNKKQCKALAMGNKACGGPQHYLPYSIQNTDVNKLVKLSEKHQQLSQKLNQLKGVLSDCAVIPKPVFVCLNNRCQKPD